MVEHTPLTGDYRLHVNPCASAGDAGGDRGEFTKAEVMVGILVAAARNFLKRHFRVSLRSARTTVAHKDIPTGLIQEKPKPRYKYLTLDRKHWDRWAVSVFRQPPQNARRVCDRQRGVRLESVGSERSIGTSEHSVLLLVDGAESFAMCTRRPHDEAESVELMCMSFNLSIRFHPLGHLSLRTVLLPQRNRTQSVSLNPKSQQGKPLFSNNKGKSGPMKRIGAVTEKSKTWSSEEASVRKKHPCPLDDHTTKQNQ
jgi:hypothetical protein